MSHHHEHHAEHPDHHVLAEVLDLDAEVFAPATRAVFDDIERTADSPVRTILDLGTGTGAGVFGLLRHFTQAHAVAVDASADMLTGVDRRADELGLVDRVTTVCADLDEALPDVEPVDLVWASASLHHLADPDRTLTQIAAAIRPGGLLAVAELDGFPRFVPDAAPGGRAERTVHALLAADRAVDMPAMGSDWGARLTAAGLDVELHRTIAVDLAPPVPAGVGRYAAAVLTRIQGAVSDRLEPADRDALQALLDGGADDVRHRTDLTVSARRWLWIARRPA